MSDGRKISILGYGCLRFSKRDNKIDIDKTEREIMLAIQQEQLSRLQTNYIDFYQMHMLFDINSWNKLKSMGIEDWISHQNRIGVVSQRKPT